MTTEEEKLQAAKVALDAADFKYKAAFDAYENAINTTGEILDEAEYNYNEALSVYRNCKTNFENDNIN